MPLLVRALAFLARAMKSKRSEKPVAAEWRLQGTKCELRPTVTAGRASDTSRRGLGTSPAHPEAVPAVLQLRVGAGSGTGSGSRPGLGQSAASSTESSGAGAAPGMFLTLPCGFLSRGAGFRLGRGCSALQPTALLQDQSLLRYVPNDFCAELPWYSLSISVFDLLHFCCITDSHHQDTVRMACAPLPGGESLGVSPAWLC